MKYTKAEIAKLTLPAGKDDHIEWNDDLPCMGIRLRLKSSTYIIQGRSDGKQWREKIGDIRKLAPDAACTIARKRFAEIMLGGDPRATKAQAKARSALRPIGIWKSKRPSCGRAPTPPSSSTLPGISKLSAASPSTASNDATLLCL
jgi:hypothetical protein